MEIFEYNILNLNTKGVDFVVKKKIKVDDTWQYLEYKNYITLFNNVQGLEHLESLKDLEDNMKTAIKTIWGR